MIGGEPAGARPAPARPPAAAAGQARMTRIGLAALLTVLVVVGLRGHIVVHGASGPYQGDGIAVGVILEAVFGGLLIALLIRERQPQPGAVLPARLRAVLRPALIGFLIGVPVVLLFAVPLRTHPRPLTEPHGPGPAPRPALPTARPAQHRSAGIHIPLSAMLYVLLVVALAAGAVACALVLRRRQATTASHPEAAPDPEAQRTGLRDAVESASSALRAFDDAQAAIIACYLSMERSLAGAGAQRGTADTPDELLARAADAGLVRGVAAARLTGLFYEARFSSHPLGAEQRDAARKALRDLADDLAHPAAQRPAGPEPYPSAGSQAPQ